MSSEYGGGGREAYEKWFYRTYPSGYDGNGYDVDGYDWRGYDQRGWDVNGYNSYGRHISELQANGTFYETAEEKLYRLWTAKYGEGGYNENGRNIDGYNQYGRTRRNDILHQQRQERAEEEEREKQRAIQYAREVALSAMPLNMEVDKRAKVPMSRRNNGSAAMHIQAGNRRGPDGDWYRQGANGAWYDLNDGGISFYSVWPENRRSPGGKGNRGSRYRGQRGVRISRSPNGAAATRRSHPERGVRMSTSPNGAAATRRFHAERGIGSARSNSGSPPDASRRYQNQSMSGKGQPGKGFFGKGKGKGDQGKGKGGKGSHGKGSRGNRM